MDLVQSTIDFPVRKTRSQIKKYSLKSDGNNDENSGRAKLKASPIKATSGTKKTKSKAKINNNKDSENITPSPERKNPIVTPVKLNHIDNQIEVIPKTPRSPLTPKRVNCNPLVNISIPSPPKRVRRLCFGDDENTPTSNLSSPTTGVVTLSRQDVTPYQKAKQALHTSTPSRILCRDNELTKLDKFLNHHLKTKTPGCLYISGAPGTGKTACLQQFIESHKKLEMFVNISVNCMTMRQSKSIYDKIGQELGCSVTQTIKEATKCIEKRLTTNGNPVVMILDEMDQLSTKNQEVLYTIFEWPRLPNSRLILIGIANALDLTDRLLPRLHACGTKPQLLHFMPYSQSQIQEILKDRLKDVIKDKNAAIFKPEAVQFCARKIAASTGDIRKALDTCRRALDIAEKGARSQRLLGKRIIGEDSSSINVDKSPVKSPKKTSIVGLPQIMSVLHDIYTSQVLSSGASKSDSFDSTMPIQQKLLLCTLLLMTKSSKIKDITVGKLHEIHRRVCRKRQIGEIESSEFLSLCDLVESRGLINMKKAKESRSTKVILKTNEDDLQFVLQDKNLLAAVLNDASVLKP